MIFLTMEPITRDEIFMAAAAGEYSGEIPEPVTRLEYYLKKIVERAAADNIQPDWNQTDSTADDYIKNKPTEGLGNLAEFKSYVMGE